MTADTTTCPHIESDVVIPAGSDTIVARVCTQCLYALPANWGCRECEWEPVQDLAGHSWLIVSRYCDDHKGVL